MSDNNAQDEAKELAAKAGEQAKQTKNQGKAAVKTTGRALRAASEPVVENVAETVESNAEEALAYVRKFTPQGLSNAALDTGLAFACLSVSIFTGVLAYRGFRQVATGRSFLVKAPQ